jgi:hypothetical protein
MPFAVHINIDVDPLATAGEAVAPAARSRRQDAAAAAGPPRWFRGDFHSHTVHSDGYNSIDEYAVEAGRRGLDFLAITDHNTSSHFEEIMHRDGNGPLLIPGEEVTTFWGHANVWGLGCWVDFRCRDDAGMQQILEWVHQRGGLFSPNHPKRGYPWEFASVTGFTVTEAWQGPWRFYNEESLDFWQDRLNRGERVVAVGGSDCHSIAPARYIHPWTLGDPCTWVFTEQPLTEESILDAVRAGHVFVSEDPSGPFLELTATCGEDTYLMGDTIGQPAGTPVTVRLRYQGPSEKKLRLLRNGAVWQQVIAGSDNVDLTFETRIEEPGHIRADAIGYRGRPERGEVVHALSNPLYFRPPS